MPLWKCSLGAEAVVIFCQHVFGSPGNVCQPGQARPLIDSKTIDASARAMVMWRGGRAAVSERELSSGSYPRVPACTVTAGNGASRIYDSLFACFEAFQASARSKRGRRFSEAGKSDVEIFALSRSGTLELLFVQDDHFYRPRASGRSLKAFDGWHERWSDGSRVSNSKEIFDAALVGKKHSKFNLKRIYFRFLRWIGWPAWGWLQIHRKCWLVFEWSELWVGFSSSNKMGNTFYIPFGICLWMETFKLKMNAMPFFLQFFILIIWWKLFPASNFAIRLKTQFKCCWR